MFLASSSRWAIDRSPATFTFDIFLLISFGLSSLATTPSAATYRILVLSINGKSHAYAMVAIAGELADRGHHVTIVVGESMPLDAPEAAIARHPRVVVERYKDGTDEHEAVYENITSMAIADRTDLREMLPMITNMYVFRFCSLLHQCRNLFFLPFAVRRVWTRQNLARGPDSFLAGACKSRSR